MKIKKKFLFLSMVAMLICVLALCISASTIYRDENGQQLFSYEKGSGNVISSYEGAFPKVDSSGNAIIWYVSSSSNVSGNTIHIVKSFKALGDEGAVKGAIDEKGYYSVSGISGSSIVSLNLPDNSGIKIINIDFGGGWTSSFPRGSHILFAYMPNTLEHYETSTNAGGGGWIPQRIFQYTQLLECYFSDLDTSNENHMKGIGNFDFYGCRSLRKCVLPNGLKTIYGNDSKDNGPAFRECWSLTELVIPNTVTGIGAKAFEDCRALVTIKLGANSNVSSGNCLFTGTSNLKYVYISNSFVNAYHYVFANGADDMVFFYTGSYEEYVSLNKSLSGRTGNTVFTSATPILWDSANDDQYYKDLATSEGKRYIVYGYSPCLAFYNGHNIASDGDQAVCTNCGEVIYCSDPEHNHEIIVSYSSYTLEGVKTIKCLDCNSSTESVKMPPLFSSLGYSVSEVGEIAVALGFAQNKEAIKEFEEASGKTINFGIFAVLKDRIGDSSIFDEDGTPADGVVSADLTSYGYTIFNLKIVGFKDEYKNVKFAMGAFVATKSGDVTEYSYIQNGEIEENEKYNFASYEDILDAVPDEIIEFDDISIKLGEEVTLPSVINVNGTEKEVTYSFDGENISIENNVLKALVEGTETTVTVSGKNATGTFKAKVLSDKYKYVVVIGVDGAGAFFKNANTPNIDEIFANGAVTYNCLTADPTISAQCWGSLLHGVTPSVHGLTNAIVSSTAYPNNSKYPSFFRVIKENNENAVLASFCNWNPINVGIVENNIGVHKVGGISDANLTNEIIAYLNGNNPTALFVQFDEADGAGHSYGYGTESQLAKISEIDGYIGRIYEAYKQNGILDETLFIVTSDHGGSGKSHGGLTDAEKYVMFAATGKNVQNGTIGEIEIRDTAAIVLHALGYENPETWTARVPSGLFEGIEAGERPEYVDKESNRYHETEPTPEEGSDGYVTNYIKDHELNTYLTFDGNIADNCGGTTAQGGNLYFVEDGYFGKGVSLDDGYVTLNNFKPGSDSYTFAFWINTKAITSDPCIISNKNWNSGMNLGFTLTIRASGVAMNIGNGSTRADCVAALPTDYTEGWMHVLAFIDRTNNKIGVCLDFGTIVTVDIPSALQGLSMDTNYVTNIGQDGTGKYGAALPATIDELMIFEGAFDEADINALKEYYGITNN